MATRSTAAKRRAVLEDGAQHVNLPPTAAAATVPTLKAAAEDDDARDRDAPPDNKKVKLAAHYARDDERHNTGNVYVHADDVAKDNDLQRLARLETPAERGVRKAQGAETLPEACTTSREELEKERLLQAELDVPQCYVLAEDEPAAAGRDSPGVENDDEDEDEVEEEEDEEEEEEEEDEEEEEQEGSDADDSDALSDGRSDGEVESIRYEISQLVRAVPALFDRYKLVDRLGEGTFSSVYKAVDLKTHLYDNPWNKNPNKQDKVYVALKRIYVTSSPVRIQNEIDILRELRGEPNIAFLIEALRHEDQVLAVMPYNRHQDFRDYYRSATLPFMRSYFACLFRALASTHKYHIIHRDVKPANFLFDMTQGTGILCDYGLAQRIGDDEFYEWKADCLHSLPGPCWGGLDGRGASKKALAANGGLAPGEAPGLHSGLHGVRLPRPMSLYEQARQMAREWDEVHTAAQERAHERQLRAADHAGALRGLPSEADFPLRYAIAAERADDKAEALADAKLLRDKEPWLMPEDWKADLKQRARSRMPFYKAWRPAMEVAASGAHGGDREGYLKDDKRPSVRANRAGTRGFRAPEVLLKCPDQTVALDVWSAGIMLLCFLTRRFPFFNSNDDTEALAEIATIFGKKRMERCSALHNRTFLTNIPSIVNQAYKSFDHLVKELNPAIVVENSPNPHGPIPSSDESDSEWYPDSELALAVDLMKRCLELDCTKRWTARECLDHPFFDEGMYDYGMGSLGPRTEDYTAV